MRSEIPSLVDHQGVSFGSKLPPLGVSRPPAGLKPLSRKSSFGVAKEWKGLASGSAWNVKGGDLELVPTDYPLERTHREILDTDASVVAGRISDALASLSIETEFNCKQAKAKCKTGDFVGFRIRLYAGDESGQPVVVEMQRRCGPAASFMRTCRAVLLAAEGMDISTNVKTQSRVPPFMKNPISEMKCLQSAFQTPRSADLEAGFALDDVANMLRSKQIDTNLLGIENLSSLTDPLKTSPDVAIIASKSIVLGDEKHDLREEIRLLTERDVFAVVATDNEKGAVNHVERLRHFALIVFANSLLMCAKDGCLEAAVKQQAWFSDYLIPSLADELRRANSNACNAHQAACCLSSLLSSSGHARSQFLEQGGRDLLSEAHAFALTRHALLARETEECLRLVSLTN